MGREPEIHFQLRPSLPDPGDEFLLELAVVGWADAIVTHNVRHFAGVERFGLRVLTARVFEDNRERGDMSRSIDVPEDLYNEAAELAARKTSRWKSSCPQFSQTGSPAESTLRPEPNYSIGKSSSEP
jgi:hypothetical protein